jgi:hypothetical protein
MSCARGDLAKGLPPIRRLLRAALWIACGAALFAGLPARAEDTPEWPCIQRKVLTLTAAQMWDGPEVVVMKVWKLVV